MGEEHFCEMESARELSSSPCTTTPVAQQLGAPTRPGLFVGGRGLPQGRLGFLWKEK